MTSLSWKMVRRLSAVCMGKENSAPAAATRQPPAFSLPSLWAATATEERCSPTTTRWRNWSIPCAITAGQMPRDKNNNVRLGMNGRLDTLQAAILLAKLDVFEEEMIKRQDIAATYTKLLAEIPGIVCPEAPVSGRSSWAQYTILLPSGTDRKPRHAEHEGTGNSYCHQLSRSLHLQKAFAFLGYRVGDFPAAEDVVTRVLSCPCILILGRTAARSGLRSDKSACKIKTESAFFSYCRCFSEVQKSTTRPDVLFRKADERPGLYSL